MTKILPPAVVIDRHTPGPEPAYRAATSPASMALTLLEQDKLRSVGDSLVARVKDHRQLPTLLGGSLGLSSAIGLAASGFFIAPLWTLLPAIGAALGFSFTYRRRSLTTQKVVQGLLEIIERSEEKTDALRTELEALHGQQSQWELVFQKDAEERSSKIDQVINHFTKIHEAHCSSLNDLVKELSFPLTSTRMATATLRRSFDQVTPRQLETIANVDEAVTHMDEMIKQLVRFSDSSRVAVQLTPQEITRSELVSDLRRRIQTLVHGRDIRTSVLTTKDAPATITVNSQFFDRIIDDLLANATKHTQHGSIVLELDGDPEHLTLKISDTGRGIPQHKIEELFDPPAPDHSPGLQPIRFGLSVVVELLDQLGGRLEVISKENVGSTFWVHIPIHPIARAESTTGTTPSTSNNSRALRQRVVTVRNVD